MSVAQEEHGTTMLVPYETARKRDGAKPSLISIVLLLITGTWTSPYGIVMELLVDGVPAVPLVIGVATTVQDSPLFNSWLAIWLKVFELYKTNCSSDKYLLNISKKLNQPLNESPMFAEVLNAKAPVLEAISVPSI